MPRPVGKPIGLSLSSAAKAISRVFDDSLAAEGGSIPTWMILMSLKTRPLANQRELADAVGIQGATLTHHLNGLEADGLVTRRRDPDNRRIHLVEMTEKGERLFYRLAAAAVAFDEKLRTGVSTTEVRVLEQLLNRLQDNVTSSRMGLDHTPPVS
jgi:MarR family transcriptional regulator for hemolysin